MDLAVTSYLGHFKNSWLIDWLIDWLIGSRMKCSINTNVLVKVVAARTMFYLLLRFIVQSVRWHCMCDLFVLIGQHMPWNSSLSSRKNCEIILKYCRGLASFKRSQHSRLRSSFCRGNDAAEDECLHLCRCRFWFDSQVLYSAYQCNTPVTEIFAYSD